MTVMESRTQVLRSRTVKRILEAKDMSSRTSSLIYGQRVSDDRSVVLPPSTPTAVWVEG